MPRLLLSPCRGMHESRKAELSRLDRTALCAQVLCSAQQLGRWLNEYFARRWWNSSGSSGSSSSRSRSSGSGGHRCLFPSESVPRSAAVYYPETALTPFSTQIRCLSLALSLHGPARTDQWVINSGDPKCMGGGTHGEERLSSGQKFRKLAPRRSSNYLRPQQLPRGALTVSARHRPALSNFPRTAATIVRTCAAAGRHAAGARGAGATCS